MLSFREAGAADFDAWNNFIAQSPNGNLRQTTYWGKVKSYSGWEPCYYLVERDGEIKAVALVQERNIPAVPQKLLYCCRGPVADWRDQETCEALFTGLKGVLKEKRGFLLRIDPEPFSWEIDQDQVFSASGFLKLSDRCTAWNRTLYTTRVILDLDEEGLFMRMRRSHRQNINSAIKGGVVTRHEPDSDDPEVFAALMQGLELRRNSMLHSSQYYGEVLNNLVNSGIGFFLKAKIEGRTVSGLVVSILGDKGWAVFMANDYSYRKLMPNKVLLWEAIRLSKKMGCRFLDLGASQGSDDFDPAHDPLDNLKSAYRPEIVHYPGYFDLPNSFYPFFRVTESKVLPALWKWRMKVQRLTHRNGMEERARAAPG
ncbi:MAG TPA: peptidoglycan bridge formation glycyltransferase FemA/FemB family protein [Syntrophorhabdaceae bacterium]